MTQMVATIGSSTTSQPTTPAPAIAIRALSRALTPPSPRRSASRHTKPVSTAWAPAITRLHEAPSARWDMHTTTASTPQISQVPRCGRVAPRRVSRT